MIKKPGAIISVAFALVVLAVLIYSTLGLHQYTVEVCMAFNGRQVCRTASAATREQAQRTATDNACALLANGMTQSMACASQPPVRITWQESQSE